MLPTETLSKATFYFRQGKFEILTSWSYINASHKSVTDPQALLIFIIWAYFQRIKAVRKNQGR